MPDEKFEAILWEIAKVNHTNPAYVRQQMQIAMDMAMESKDPVIQARWAAVPKKGDRPTLEEFVAYMASQLSSSPK